MPATILPPTAAPKLRELLDRLAASTGESLGSLVTCEVSAQATEVALTDAESLRAALLRPNVVARASSRGQDASQLLLLLEARDACTLAGLLLMTPAVTIAQQRASGTFAGEAKEAFAELGGVLCSTYGAVLRAAGVEDSLRFRDLGIAGPEGDPQGCLPGGTLLACTLRLQIADFPESTAFLLLDPRTAAKWSPEPIPGLAAARDGDGAPAARGDEDLADIPAAPVRGVLNAYLTTSDPAHVLRRSSRRVGLDLRRHNRAEVPNPAAHRGEIVLMDVPADQYRQFDWCRRIKEFSDQTKVVLLLHHPSRARVTHAFLARADVILGLPIEEGHLSAKLKALIDP